MEISTLFDKTYFETYYCYHEAYVSIIEQLSIYGETPLIQMVLFKVFFRIRIVRINESRVIVMFL